MLINDYLGSGGILTIKTDGATGVIGEPVLQPPITRVAGDLAGEL